MRLACLPIVTALLALCFLPAQAQAACPSASVQPSQAEARELARATLCLVNEQRQSRGLAPLKLHRRLSKAAQRHSEDMARNDFFSHVSPSGATFVQRIRRTGYLRGARRWTVGENIAWGGGSRSTPGATVEAWMQSPAHRDNMLAPTFRELGVGIANDAPVAGASGATYTTTFGLVRR